jgi:hypothetical protein
VITPADMPARRGGGASAEVVSGQMGESGGQRFGRITDRQPAGSGPGGRMGTYFVRDDVTGETYSFSYADIVTEGFRTIRTGERVRFLLEAVEPGHAAYVIRLDLPDVGAYYR